MKIMRISAFTLFIVAFTWAIVYFSNNPIVSKPSNEKTNEVNSKEENKQSVQLNDTGEIAKINIYVDAMNRESGRVMDSYNHYCSWLVNPENGPTGKEDIIYGLYTIYDPSDFVASMNAIEKSGPALSGIDDKAKRYKKSLVIMNAVLFEVNHYYEQENYKDDAMAQGKQMHKGLMDAFKDYFDKDADLRKAIKDWFIDYDKTEKGEHNTAYYEPSKNLMLIGEGMVDKLHLSDVKLIQEINLKPFNEDIKLFENNYLKLSRFETQDMNEMVKPIFSFYLMRASEFLSASKALMRRVRDNIPYSDDELNSACWLVAGSHWDMIDHYNDLVDSFNNIKEYKNDDIFVEIPHAYRLHILPCINVKK